LGFWRSKFVQILKEARKSEILTQSTTISSKHTEIFV
jgi:hypothetical protein